MPALDKTGQKNSAPGDLRLEVTRSYWQEIQKYEDELFSKSPLGITTSEIRRGSTILYEIPIEKWFLDREKDPIELQKLW